VRFLVRRFTGYVNFTHIVAILVVVLFAFPLVAMIRFRHSFFENKIVTVVRKHRSR
jgi:hypothetical protein